MASLQNPCKVIGEVVYQKGQCPEGHKTGDIIDMTSRPIDCCPILFYVCYPTIRVLQHGGNIPWEKPNTSLVACPDAKNPVWIELRRVEDEPADHIEKVR